MNKYVLIGIGILTFACLFLFMKEVIIKSMKSSKELELTYEINAGIPFKWEYEIEDESVVEFVRSYVVKDENVDGKVGAPITTNYVFKGKKEGETTITFKIVSITGEYEETQKEVNKVKVGKNLKITLVKEGE